MKNVLREWLGINEEVSQLQNQLNTTSNNLLKVTEELNGLSRYVRSIEDELSTTKRDADGLLDEVRDVQTELEDKVNECDVESIVRDTAYCNIEDIESDLEETIDYERIQDNVFDIIIREIDNTDRLTALVTTEFEKRETVEAQGYPVDITAITEDVVEELVNKLRA